MPCVCACCAIVVIVGGGVFHYYSPTPLFPLLFLLVVPIEGRRRHGNLTLFWCALFGFHPSPSLPSSCPPTTTACAARAPPPFCPSTCCCRATTMPALQLQTTLPPPSSYLVLCGWFYSIGPCSSCLLIIRSHVNKKKNIVTCQAGRQLLMTFMAA